MNVNKRRRFCLNCFMVVLSIVWIFGTILSIVIHNSSSIKQKDNNVDNGTSSNKGIQSDMNFLNLNSTSTSQEIPVRTKTMKDDKNNNNDDNNDNNSDNTMSSSKFLLGIFTHDLYRLESERRQMIRDTYLSYYINGHDNVLNRTNMICSLHDILRNHHVGTSTTTTTTMTSTNNYVPQWPKDCRLAYTFVRGVVSSSSSSSSSKNDTSPAVDKTIKATPDYPLELMDKSYSEEMLVRSMTTPTHFHVGQNADRDVLTLAIEENGDYGKSPTWFRYATLLLQEYQFPVDYIVKIDSDALLIPHRFFRWIDEQEEQQQIRSSSSPSSSATTITATADVNHDYRNVDSTTNGISSVQKMVYGGVPMDKFTCGYPQHDHCSQLVAPIYMGGALYFLSTNLATYVVSNQCPRKQLFLPHEDMAMGNYVFSYNTHVKNNKNNAREMITAAPMMMITNFSFPDAYLNTWKHPIKDPKRMKNTWRKFLSSKYKRQKQANK